MVEYLDAVFKKGRAAQILEQRRINYIVLGAHRRKSPLVQYLNGDGKTLWSHIYRGTDADIWVRRKALSGNPLRTSERRVP